MTSWPAYSLSRVPKCSTSLILISLIEIIKSPVTKSELKEQLILNEEELISIKGLPQLFAYPFGQPITCFDDKTDQIVLNSGVKKIFYANPGLISSLNNQKLNRVSMDNHFNSGLIKYKISAIPFLNIFKSKFDKVLKMTWKLLSPA